MEVEVRKLLWVLSMERHTGGHELWLLPVTTWFVAVPVGVAREKRLGSLLDAVAPTPAPCAQATRHLEAAQDDAKTRCVSATFAS